MAARYIHPYFALDTVALCCGRKRQRRQLLGGIQGNSHLLAYRLFP